MKGLGSMVQGSLARPGAPVEMQKQPQRVKPTQKPRQTETGTTETGTTEDRAAPRTRAEAELTQAVPALWLLLDRKANTYLE